MKEERDHLVARIPGLDRGEAGVGEQPVESEPEVALLPEALIEEAADALDQAATAYRAATARIRQLDRIASPQQTRLVRQKGAGPNVTHTSTQECMQHP
ncbi:hypothetical protein ACIQ9Q_40555 [Streptomyces sp. NPDC094438]|uniref:hypothetical protein n=1 Tax=Streptomyces sp. NPDC094438 TaxID=3366061 RepID=UPI003802CAD0